MLLYCCVRPRPGMRAMLLLTRNLAKKFVSVYLIKTVLVSSCTMHPSHRLIRLHNPVDPLSNVSVLSAGAGPIFTAVDLASHAERLDQEERATMAEGGFSNPEFLRFMQVGTNVCVCVRECVKVQV